MSMKPQTTFISGRECQLFCRAGSKHLLIQPVDDHDTGLSAEETDIISQLSETPYNLVTFRINDWNRELTPWPAPPVFGKQAFGDAANDTLAFIIEQLLPEMGNKGIDTSHCQLGGYSLAGLFALWSAYQTDIFEGIAAVSPSVWYPGWISYVSERKANAHSIYLSLGDKEEKTKNRIMSQVGLSIRAQHKLLLTQGTTTILEWNAGNHFVDSARRMAKGFAWLLMQS